MLFTCKSEPKPFIIQAMKQSVPSSIQGLIWSKNNDMIDLEKDKSVIIHHTLRYGTVGDIAWLLQTYPKDTITSVFTTQPMTIYSPSSFNFIKRTVLNITQELPNEKRYIQSFS